MYGRSGLGAPREDTGVLVWGEVTSLMQWLELLWGFVELTGASTGRFVLPHRWRRVCVGHVWVITDAVCWERVQWRGKERGLV